MTPATQESESRSQIEGLPELWDKLQASLFNLKDCLKIESEKEAGPLAQWKTTCLARTRP